MDYELAKKLKEAGFPQTRPDTDCKEDGTLMGEMVTIPALSELIEACGKDFSTLFKCYEENISPLDSVRWIASQRMNEINVTGTTPEEAVANLYLALNKK